LKYGTENEKNGKKVVETIKVRNRFQEKSIC